MLGELSRAAVRVEQGKTADLGEMTWTPVRSGRQLWENGIPNRSAEEFLHGDHYWQWGLYQLHPQEFPNDVDFVIGRSDWDCAQPPRPNGKGGWTNTTWRIRFDLDRAPQGSATLQPVLRRS